eukprot:182825-Amphidinium_carterae.1
MAKTDMPSRMMTQLGRPRLQPFPVPGMDVGTLRDMHCLEGNARGADRWGITVWLTSNCCHLCLQVRASACAGTKNCSDA